MPERETCTEAVGVRGFCQEFEQHVTLCRGMRFVRRSAWTGSMLDELSVR